MKRFIAVTISLYLAACISLCCIFVAGPQDKINNTEANDIIFTVRKYWPDAERAVSMMQGLSCDRCGGKDGGSIQPGPQYGLCV